MFEDTGNETDDVEERRHHPWIIPRIPWIDFSGFGIKKRAHDISSILSADKSRHKYVNKMKTKIKPFNLHDAVLDDYHLVRSQAVDEKIKAMGLSAPNIFFLGSALEEQMKLASPYHKKLNFLRLEIDDGYDFNLNSIQTKVSTALHCINSHAHYDDRVLILGGLDVLFHADGCFNTNPGLQYANMNRLTQILHDIVTVSPTLLIVVLTPLPDKPKDVPKMKKFTQDFTQFALASDEWKKFRHRVRILNTMDIYQLVQKDLEGQLLMRERYNKQDSNVQIDQYKVLSKMYDSFLKENGQYEFQSIQCKPLLTIAQAVFLSTFHMSRNMTDIKNIWEKVTPPKMENYKTVQAQIFMPETSKTILSQYSQYITEVNISDALKNFGNDTPKASNFRSPTTMGTKVTTSTPTPSSSTPPAEQPFSRQEPNPRFRAKPTYNHFKPAAQNPGYYTHNYHGNRNNQERTPQASQIPPLMSIPSRKPFFQQQYRHYHPNV